MKRLFAVFGIMAVLLTGCAESNTPQTQIISDANLKQQCAPYISRGENYAKDLTNKLSQGIHEGSLVRYQGTFYSKTKNTCLSIYDFTVLPSGVIYDVYRDEFTGKNSPEVNLNNIQNYEKSLNLIK